MSPARSCSSLSLLLIFILSRPRPNFRHVKALWAAVVDACTWYHKAPLVFVARRRLRCGRQLLKLLRPCRGYNTFAAILRTLIGSCEGLDLTGSKDSIAGPSEEEEDVEGEDAELSQRMVTRPSQRCHPPSIDAARRRPCCAWLPPSCPAFGASQMCDDASSAGSGGGAGRREKSSRPRQSLGAVSKVGNVHVAVWQEPCGAEKFSKFFHHEYRH
ncbi:hypothetical protein IWZ03DRAFT_123853 [Phyllosticta citriasiana]|uniref:Secreted protein n=1 Tax=Phyllosticta citriasiana TaxID=595635 RepID=A0ABR1K9H0_9PEZI